MAKKRVLISGAGISGFLTYLYLDREKYEVTLVERNEHFRTVGYAIVIWNGGFDILRKTVFKDNPEYAGRFTRLEKSLLVNGHTFPESLYSLRNLGYVVNREDLLKIFIAEAEKIDGEMLTGMYIEDVSTTDTGYAVTFNDGKTREFDLIAVCEGINSPTRGRFFKDVRIVDSDYAVEYAETKRVPALSGKNIIFEFNNLTGVIMTSFRSTVSAHFLLKNKGGYLSRREKHREMVQQMLVREYGPTAVLEYPTETQLFDLKDVYVKNFHAENVVLLGDAAHGRVPVLGLGTTLATEDAFFFSGILNALDIEAWERDINAALDAYSTKRHERSEELYAIQDIVNRASLPKEHPAPPHKHSRAFKFVLNFIDKFRNRAFTLMFNRAIRYDIGRDLKRL